MKIRLLMITFVVAFAGAAGLYWQIGTAAPQKINYSGEFDLRASLPPEMPRSISISGFVARSTGLYFWTKFVDEDNPRPPAVIHTDHRGRMQKIIDLPADATTGTIRGMDVDTSGNVYTFRVNAKKPFDDRQLLIYNEFGELSTNQHIDEIPATFCVSSRGELMGVSNQDGRLFMPGYADARRLSGLPAPEWG